MIGKIKSQKIRERNVKFSRNTHSSCITIPKRITHWTTDVCVHTHWHTHTGANTQVHMICFYDIRKSYVYMYVCMYVCKIYDKCIFSTKYQKTLTDFMFVMCEKRYLAHRKHAPKANINREINQQELDRFFNRHLRNYFHNELHSLSLALQKFIKFSQSNHKVGTKPFPHSAKFTKFYICKEYPFPWLEKCDILHKQIRDKLFKYYAEWSKLGKWSRTHNLIVWSSRRGEIKQFPCYPWLKG